FVAQFIGSPAMNLLPGEIVEPGEVTKVRVETGQGTIVANIPTTESDRGAHVNVGIRPEDMIATDHDDYAFAGKVEIVEALGEVTQLYFEKSGADEAAVIGKLQGIHAGVKGSQMKMTAHAAKVHLFQNGQSLLYR
ncbi:TOBE domain-containing protein, partial [Roseobacter litoralis]